MQHCRALLWTPARVWPFLSPLMWAHLFLSNMYVYLFFFWPDACQFCCPVTEVFVTKAELFWLKWFIIFFLPPSAKWVYSLGFFCLFPKNSDFTFCTFHYVNWIWTRENWVFNAMIFQEMNWCFEKFNWESIVLIRHNLENHIPVFLRFLVHVRTKTKKWSSSSRNCF